MATEQNFTVRKGRTSEVVVTVLDVDDWTGLDTKLYAYSSMEESSVEFTVDGVVAQSANEITFNITHDMLKDLDVSSLYYEVVVYRSDKTYIKDTNYGLIYIAPVGLTNPTV